MLKKTVTYTDPFEGTEVTEDLYFNLTKAEVAEMVISEGDNYAAHLEALTVAKDGKAVMTEFKKLLGMAYGKREGNRHIKSPEITEEFLSSEVYSELFMELITQPDSGASFFQAILPKDLDKIAAQITTNEAKVDSSDKRPAWIREDREPTTAELTSMTKAQMVEVMQRRAAKA